MKPPRACHECRISKRKCDRSNATSRAACLPCQQRNLTCSKAFHSQTSQNLAPSTAVQVAMVDDISSLLCLNSEPALEFVDLYFTFIHDRPHSLFHEKTLKDEIRAGTLPKSLLAAICAFGCRFSADPKHRELKTAFRVKSSSLFSQELEKVSVHNIQTCILLGNLFAVEQDNWLETLYFGIANRMAYILRLHKLNVDDPPVLREIKCRTWWSLYMADRWCPPGLGLPREISQDVSELDMPMDEMIFQAMDPKTQVFYGHRKDGFWKYMVTLVNNFGPIQDLNHSLVQNRFNDDFVDQQVARIANHLQEWYESLPSHLIMNDRNLDMHRNNSQGGTFIALHFGYHHYCTLLYFQYLEASSKSRAEASLYAKRCRFHALSFSRLLHYARQKGDCQVVFLTVAHLTLVSSSVLLHMLLFGYEEEVETARVQLVHNFDALVELQKYWPNIKVTERLMLFQNACLRSTTTNAYTIDRWMVRFLLEHALPLDEKDPKGHVSTDASSSRRDRYRIPAERTDMLNEAFVSLHA